MSRLLEVLVEACGELVVVRRKMFGGYGFFAPNGGMFAGIVSSSEIVLKLGGPARDELVALGGKPWTYDGQSKPMTMSSWIVVPERFYDDFELFNVWAARAHALAPAKRLKPANSPKPTKPAKPAKSAKARRS